MKVPRVLSLFNILSDLIYNIGVRAPIKTRHRQPSRPIVSAAGEDLSERKGKSLFQIGHST